MPGDHLNEAEAQGLLLLYWFWRRDPGIGKDLKALPRLSCVTRRHQLKPLCVGMGKLGPEKSITGRARIASLGPSQERRQPWAPSLLTEREAERPHHQLPFRHIALGEGG